MDPILHTLVSVQCKNWVSSYLYSCFPVAKGYVKSSYIFLMWLWWDNLIITVYSENGSGCTGTKYS